MRLWDPTSGRIVEVDGTRFEGRRLLGFLSPTSRIATTARTGNGVTRDIEVWDIRTRTRLLRVERVPATHYAAPGDLAVSDLALNEHIILGPGLDDDVWIRRGYRQPDRSVAGA